MIFHAWVQITTSVFAAGFFAIAAQAEPADLIFQNGAIYTLNPKQEWVQAVAVKGKKIVYAGDDQGAAAFKGDVTKVVDLNGRLMLPGFVEAHVHLLAGAAVTRGAQLGINSREALLDYLRHYAKTAPNRGLIHGVVRGSAWRHDIFPLSGPTKADLDAIWPDVPVFFFDSEGHAAWVNSKALDMAGISKDTPPVVPGFSYFQKDQKTGEPTGYVVEEPAYNRVLSRIGPFTAEYLTESLEEWTPKASAEGITSAFDAGFVVTDVDGGFTILQNLEKAGKLPFRVVGCYYDTKPDVDALPIIESMRSRYQSELVKGNVLKIMMDGVEGNETAALLEPYADNPELLGRTLFTEKQAINTLTRADARGFDVHIHAIGDRGARAALNAMEAAIKANPPRERRFTLAHNQLTADADIPRFGQLGLFANFTGQWHCPDHGTWRKMEIPRLGPHRADRMYRMEEIRKTGATVTLGSDWPACGGYMSFRPLDAIQVAVTRQDPDDPNGDILPPADNRVPLVEAIRANTINAARQLGLEKEVGSIEVGKAADLIVIDRNLFEINPHEIAQTKVDLTLMNGSFTHGGQ